MNQPLKRKLGTILSDNMTPDEVESATTEPPFESSNVETVVNYDSEPEITDPPNSIVQGKNRVPDNIAPTSPPSIYEGRIKNNVNQRYGVLTTQIQGHRYPTIAFYNQYVGKHDSNYDIGKSSTRVTNQYIRILNVELRMDSPMPSYNIDNVGKVTYTGNATTPHIFVPSKGDLFTAEVDTGRIYLFKISSSPVRRTVFDQAAYNFDFESIADCNADDELLKDLESKVVQKKVFVSNLTQYTENSILTEEAYATYQDLMKYRFNLTNDYCDLFHDSNVGTLLVPGQSYLTYDGFAVKGFNLIRELYNYGLDDGVQVLNDLDGSTKPIRTIWDAMQDGSGFRRAMVLKMSPIPRKGFSYKPYFRSVRYSGAEYIMSPRGHKDNQKLYEAGRDFYERALDPSETTINGGKINIVNSQYGTKLPLVNPVNADDYYIFSKSFYTAQTPTSSIEYLITQYLDQKVINPTMVLELCQNVHQWGEVEYYYYTPFILFLIEQVFVHGL